MSDYLVDTVKKHPIVKTTGALLTFITVIIGVFITIDERYAHASDIKELKIQQTATVLYLKDENERSVLEMRKRSLDDKVFELNLKERQSISDKALIKRFESESKSIDERMIILKNNIRSKELEIR